MAALFFDVFLDGVSLTITLLMILITYWMLHANRKRRLISMNTYVLCITILTAAILISTAIHY